MIAPMQRCDRQELFVAKRRGKKPILHRGTVPARAPGHQGAAAARYQLHQKIDRSYLIEGRHLY
jgi:hypothetical protein